jgi:hypothetical protein
MLLKTQFPARSSSARRLVQSFGVHNTVLMHEQKRFQTIESFCFLFVLQFLHYEKPDRLEEIFVDDDDNDDDDKCVDFKASSCDVTPFSFQVTPNLLHLKQTII